MSWLLANKQWLFSGVAVAVPLAVAGWCVARRSSQRSQRQRGGTGSTNIQVGGSVTVDRGKHDD